MRVKDKLKSKTYSEWQEAVASSLSIKQTLVYLGISVHTRSYPDVREFLTSLNISIEHFTINGRPSAKILEKLCPNCNKVYTVPDNKKGRNQQTCSTGCYNTLFRTGINSPNYKTGISSYRAKIITDTSTCNRCGFAEVLEVHHKDRNRLNNSIDNLEILCPNCHAMEHRGVA